jgi:hypothetical protein
MLAANEKYKLGFNGQRAVELYNQNYTCAQIALATDSSFGRVRTVLLEHGISIPCSLRHSSLTEFEVEHVKDLYSKGATVNQIEAKTLISRTAFKKYLGIECKAIPRWDPGKKKEILDLLLEKRDIQTVADLTKNTYKTVYGLYAADIKNNPSVWKNFSLIGKRGKRKPVEIEYPVEVDTERRREYIGILGLKGFTDRSRAYRTRAGSESMAIKNVANMIYSKKEEMIKFIMKNLEVMEVE